MHTRLRVLGILVLAACGSGSTGPSDELVSISVEPANATLVSAGGPVVQAYTVIGELGNGQTVPLPDATLDLDAEGHTLGSFTGAELTAFGTVAGKGGVHAQYHDLTAYTAVYVEVHPVRLGPGVPPDAADRFPDGSPPGALSPSIVYPLDGAVMPASVKAPDVQWEGANGATDLYRVRMQTGLATVDMIVRGDPASKLDARPLPEDWQLLVNTAGNGFISVTVDHWDAVNGAHAGTPVRVKLVKADITGVLYYWNLDAGRMERIDAMGHADAIPYPPPRAGDGLRCVACHSVSRDGRYLSGSLWVAGSQGAVFDMSDPAVRIADPAPTIAPVTASSYTQLYSTFNPDATRLLVNVGTGLSLIDPRNGTSVATSGTPLPTSNASHPVWSPDGTTIAYINNLSHNGAAATWAVDYTAGDLALIPVTGADAFGPPAQLVTSGSVDPAFAAPSWPTFSPDSAWIAYGAGMHSRGRMNGTTFPGALFMVARTGGAPQQLANACGGQRTCYLPNFSPYDAGGYYWLVFYSFRDYGNALAGTKGTGRRQLWITAIEKAKLAAGDPSSVPYWVPDQDTATQNMSAFWSVPAPIL